MRSAKYCCLAGLAGLFTLLLIPWVALGRDYVEVKLPVIRGLGVYYDEMFRGKVNPAAVGYVRESLSFDIVSDPDDPEALHMLGEYNTNRLSISDVRSELAHAKASFDDSSVGDAYEPVQDVDELFIGVTSFNIDLSRSIRIGMGQRVTHVAGMHFRRRGKSLGQSSVSLGNFDMDLSSFAVDGGLAIRLSRNLYLSLYGLNLVYLGLGDPSFEKVGDGGMIPKMEIRAPIVVGGGPTFALAQLVLSLDAHYLPQVGDPPVLRGTAFYTLFFSEERFRFKIGMGGQTVADSDWRNRFKAEGVISLWMGKRLSLRYSIIIAREEDDDKDHFYHRGGISGLWR